MNATNPKRSSRLAAKEQRESAEPKEVEVDSRKRGRDKSDNFSSIYKRATPASTKKATQIATVNEVEVHSPGASIPIRVRDKLASASTPPPAHLTGASTDQRSNTPSLVSDGPSLHRINPGNGVNGPLSELEKDVVHSPAQRAPNNPLVSKLKESQKVKGSLSHVKLSPKPSPPPVPVQQQQGLGAKNARLSTEKSPTPSFAPAGHHARIGQHEARLSAVRPEACGAGPEMKHLNERTAPPAAHKPARERHGGRPAADHGAAGGLGGAENDDLRRRLGGAVERWISARSALPGGEGDDLCGFRPEIERLVKLIAFEAFEIKQELDEESGEGDVGAGHGGDSSSGVAGDTYGREVTTTRFRLEHPEVNAPFVFESTQHVFSGSVLGAATAGGLGRQRHRLEGLKWKVEFELIGFFVLALHTQTFEVDEDVEIPRLEKVREALQTHITSSELGVLFMLAGSASLGPAAWQFVEDVCFWTANFSLPEFPGPS